MLSHFSRAHDPRKVYRWLCDARHSERLITIDGTTGAPRWRRTFPNARRYSSTAFARIIPESDCLSHSHDATRRENFARFFRKYDYAEGFEIRHFRDLTEECVSSVRLSEDPFCTKVCTVLCKIADFTLFNINISFFNTLHYYSSQYSSSIFSYSTF